MKIAIVTKTLGFRGGIERYLVDLARSLRMRGHKLVLLHGDEKGRDVEEFVAPFVRDAHISEAAKTSFDVAYVQNALDAEELAALGDRPVVFAAHDHDHTCIRRHRYLPLDRSACHRAPGAACVANGCCVTRDRGAAVPIALRNPYSLKRELAEQAQRGTFVACSHYIADKLVAAGAPRDRVAFVHPVPPDDDRPVSPLPEARNLAIVAQLVRGKGVDIAIEALAHLPADVTLTIAGDGPSRSELEALAARVAPGRVKFLGYVRPEAVDAVYDGARAVVVPSRWPEPFGLIGIEAMRRARPVVAAAHGGILEWVPRGRGGAFFQPGDAKDLARAIAELMGDSEAGTIAREHVLATFRHEDAVDSIERILLRAALRPARKTTRQEAVHA